MKFMSTGHGPHTNFCGKGRGHAYTADNDVRTTRVCDNIVTFCEGFIYVTKRVIQIPTGVDGFIPRLDIRFLFVNTSENYEAILRLVLLHQACSMQLITVLVARFDWIGIGANPLNGSLLESRECEIQIQQASEDGGFTLGS